MLKRYKDIIKLNTSIMESTTTVIDALDYEDSSITEHPLNHLDFESKIIYLSAVAIFIKVSENITLHKKEKFSKLIDLLDCTDAKEELFSLLEKPYEYGLDEIFSFIKKYHALYTMEVIFLMEENDLPEHARELLVDIMFYCKYNRETIDLFIRYILAIKNNEEHIYAKCIDMSVSDDSLYNENLFYDVSDFYRLDIRFSLKLTKYLASIVSKKTSDEIRKTIESISW